MTADADAVGTQEKGTHDELLAAGGRDAELWQSWTHGRAAHHGVAALSGEQLA